jgi:hypothetical protein
VNRPTPHGEKEASRHRQPPLVAFPAHALLILEERLREQGAEGVEMPEGISLDELALRVLIAAETRRSPL